jgi:hypothetical protein
VLRRRADQRHRPGFEEFVEVADEHLTPEVSEAARGDFVRINSGRMQNQTYERMFGRSGRCATFASELASRWIGRVQTIPGISIKRER